MGEFKKMELISGGCQCCGSGFKSLGWIRIRIQYPDSASEIEP